MLLSAMGVLFIVIGLLQEAALHVPRLGRVWYGHAWRLNAAGPTARARLQQWARCVGGAYILLGIGNEVYVALYRPEVGSVARLAPALVLALLAFASLIRALLLSPLDRPGEEA